MTWNHRVVRRDFADCTIFGIHEVFYTETGISCTVDPVEVSGETLAGLEITLRHMLEALEKPTLDWDLDFPVSATVSETPPWISWYITLPDGRKIPVGRERPFLEIERS